MFLKAIAQIPVQVVGTDACRLAIVVKVVEYLEGPYTHFLTMRFTYSKRAPVRIAEVTLCLVVHLLAKEKVESIA